MISEKTQDQALLHLAQALRERGYHFVTPTPLTHERVNQRPENALAEDMHGIFGWSRPFQRELLPPALFNLMELADVLEACGSRWRSRVRLSSLDGQLFVHSAFPTDAPDAVFFGPDTYRFASAIQAHLNHHRATLPVPWTSVAARAPGRCSPHWQDRRPRYWRWISIPPPCA